MLSSEVDVNNCGSNLAITDHLPADIIRSLWVIQSLNIKFNDRKEELYAVVDKLKLLCRFQILSANNESDYNNNKNVDDLLHSLSKLKMLEDEKVQIINKIRNIDLEIKYIHYESIKEAIKLRLLLDCAKQFLNSLNYQLIQIIFSQFWNDSNLKHFVKEFTQNEEEFNTFETHIDGSRGIQKILRNFEFFKRPNNHLVAKLFSDFSEEFKKMISSLFEKKCDKQKRKNDLLNYAREEQVLSILSKNAFFDKRYSQSSQKKLKLVFRPQQVTNDNTNDNNRLKLAIHPTKLSDFSEDSDFELLSSTPTIASTPAPQTPKLILKLPTSLSETAEEDVIANRISRRLKAQEETKNIYVDKSLNNIEIEKPVERPIPQKKIVVTKKQEEEEVEEVYCICQTGSSGKMIGCDNDDCEFGGWFHYKCIGLLPSYEPPKNRRWYCKWCSEKKNEKARPVENSKNIHRNSDNNNRSNINNDKIDNENDIARKRKYDLVEPMDDIDSLLRSKKLKKVSFPPTEMIPKPVVESSTINNKPVDIKPTVIEPERIVRHRHKRVFEPVKRNLRSAEPDEAKATKKETSSKDTLRRINILRRITNESDDVSKNQTRSLRSIKINFKEIALPAVKKRTPKLVENEKTINNNNDNNNDLPTKLRPRAEIKPRLESPPRFKINPFKKGRPFRLEKLIEDFVNDPNDSGLSDLE